MSVISAVVVKRSRRTWWCASHPNCGPGHEQVIPAGSTYLRLYGNAGYETPRVVRYCIDCARELLKLMPCVGPALTKAGLSWWP